jgi:MarR family transcriptional regulator, lower aerobic nicotinate degradation pathway regulator
MDSRRDLLGVLLPLTRELRRIEDAAAAADQLTMWQYAVLALVEASPANQTSLANRLDYSKNRLVHDIDHLEQLGMVTRQVLPADRRSNLVTITGRGRSARARIQGRIHAAEDDLLRHVPASTRKRFDRLAVEVTAGLPRRD